MPCGRDAAPIAFSMRGHSMNLLIEELSFGAVGFASVRAHFDVAPAAVAAAGVTVVRF